MSITVALLTGFFGLLSTGIAVGMALGLSSSGWSNYGSIVFIFAMIGIALLLAALKGTLEAMTVVRFYERGAVRRLRRREVVIPYLEATSLTYSLTRNVVHGVPVGTSVTICVKADRKRRISFSGSYRGRDPGGGFLRSRAGSVDALDIARDLISEHIAGLLAERLVEGASLVWAGQLTMTVDGLARARGRNAGVTIPYGEIGRIEIGRGLASLYRGSDRRPLVLLPVVAPNFWPCLRVFETFAADREGDLLEVADSEAHPDNGR